MAEDLHLVTFRVGGELFGVPISKVQEIVRVPSVAHIPQAPDFVEGVINLRGRVITVACMRKRLGQGAAEGAEQHQRRRRVLVVEAGGRTVGVIVDEVAEVIKLGEALIEPAPPMVAGLSNRYINGVGKLESELLILIDIDQILTGEELLAVGSIEDEAAAA